MRSSEDRRDRGALEAAVIDTLRAAARPLTAREVQGALGDDSAYTTVMTTLARLFDKGALVREQVGRAYAYRLSADTDEIAAVVTARRMRRLLESGGDRTVALQRFVSELAPEDERYLADLLRALDSDRPS